MRRRDCRLTPRAPCATPVARALTRIGRGGAGAGRPCSAVRPEPQSGVPPGWPARAFPSPASTIAGAREEAPPAPREVACRQTPASRQTIDRATASRPPQARPASMRRGCATRRARRPPGCAAQEAALRSLVGGARSRARVVGAGGALGAHRPARPREGRSRRCTRTLPPSQQGSPAERSRTARARPRPRHARESSSRCRRHPR